MKNSKLLLKVFVTVLTVAVVKPTSARDSSQELARQSRGCDPPPQSLLQKPRREYKGRYENKAYGYSVVIPKGFVGYDVVNPFYQQGFVIIFGEEPQSYINVFPERNSLEADSAVDVANRKLGYLREDGKAIESAKITPTHLGQLLAAQILVTFACPGSTERFEWFSTIALSPDKGMVYEAILHAPASRFDHDRAVLDGLLKSWKYIGY